MASLAASSSAPRDERAIGWGRFALVGLGTVVAAILANMLVYYLGRAVVGYDPQFVILAAVATTIFFTAIPALGAVALYALLLRFAAHPARTFAIIAAVVFVVTTIPDFAYIPGAPGASAGQTAILVCLHLVAAAVITSLLTRFTRPGKD